jgi:hypothetical protein
VHQIAELGVFGQAEATASDHFLRGKTQH